MFSRLGVLSSDALNRDGYVIAFETLEQMIAKNALTGLPQLIDHDFHRPLGWIMPYGILIEPKISKTVGKFYFCDTDEDRENIHPKIQSYWQRHNYEACKPYVDDFKRLLQSEFSDKGRFYEKGAVAYHLNDIVTKVYPKLFSNTDKSGLIYLQDILDDFDYAGSGIFKDKKSELCIFCHQFFNRSLSLFNNFNTYFIDEFILLNSRTDINLRIAIDPNLIGLSKTMKGFLELDYWWGPKFDDDISNLPDQVTRYECNDEQKMFSNVTGTEFWWKSDGNEKSLEIEEIRERPSFGVGADAYGCRYIHSIYDKQKEEFMHFDGAVRMYTEEQILERWDVNINKAGKNTDYTKLFRIDGKLGLDDWKKLCILYYKGNPLLFEYFGAKEEYDKLKNSTIEQAPDADFLPNKITSEDGIRIFVSYFQKSGDYHSFERKAINPDIIQFRNGEIINILEYDIIELEKFLKRKGGVLKYPDEVQFVKPFDFYTNYPIIIHGSNNTEQLVSDTLISYRSIFEIQNKKLNKTLSMTIGWEMADFEVRFSIFGKSSEITKWLNVNEQIPIEYASFKDWLVKQRKWICENYEYKERDFMHLVKDDGMFYMKRTTITPEIISFPNEEDHNYYEIDVRGDKSLIKLLDENAVYPSQLGLIQKITCTKTGENYLTSYTSKYLDDDVAMAIEKIDVIGFFWTDEQYH